MGNRYPDMSIGSNRHPNHSLRSHPEKPTDVQMGHRHPEKLCDVPRGEEIEKRHVQMGQRHPEKSSCSQFHQHFTCTFFANILSQKNYEAKIKQRKAARSTFVQKCTCKMLMKLIPDVQKGHDILKIY